MKTGYIGKHDSAQGESMRDLAGHAVACCVGIPASGREIRKDTDTVQLPDKKLWLYVIHSG